MMVWGGKGCEERHGLVMNGTMEEDRRLRNKARRERILTVGVRQPSSSSSSSVKKDAMGMGSATGMGSTIGQGMGTTTNGMQHATNGMHPATNGMPHATNGMPHATNGIQHATNGMQRVPSQQSTTMGFGGGGDSGGGFGPVRHQRPSHVVAPY